MTQAQLSAITGISQPNLSAYENDRRSPTLDVLNRIVVACGYQLMADSGRSQISFPLPVVGWFPDEDLPPRLPSDPLDQPPPRPPGPTDRGQLVYEVLQLADAIR